MSSLNMDNIYWSDSDLSVCSNLNEYISTNVSVRVDDIFQEISNRAEVRELLFTPTGIQHLRRCNNKLKNRLIIKEFSRYKTCKLAVKLLKFYNDHGYLCKDNQFKFINLAIKYNSRNLIKMLRVSDVSKIRNYNHNKLNNFDLLFKRLKNKELSDRIKARSTIDAYKTIVNNLTTNYVNKFINLFVEEGVESAWEADEHGVDVEVSVKVRKHRSEDDYWPVYDDTTYTPFIATETPVRDPGLLARLHSLIKHLVNARKPKLYREIIEMVDFDDIPSTSTGIRDVQPEMMEPQTVNQQQESGPVVLNMLEDDEVVQSTQSMDNSFWINNSTSDAIVNVQHASSMEILIHSFEWSSSDTSGKNLFNIELPIKAITENPTHPASMLFNQYAYWNGDIRIRVHINTTPFHIGKLIFSWYYAAAFDANVEYRDNIASSLLLPNVCFNASHGNDVVLEIPYRNYRSMLCTRNDASVDSKPLYLGDLRCHVFNPISSSGPTFVNGYVHVSFINNQFTGISPRVDVQPEMMSINKMVKVAESTMKVADAIINLDKPANVVPPIMHTPQLSDSFASGTHDINNMHMLRLDPAGQTPHPLGSSTKIQETLIKNIISKEGLLRIISWSTSSARGYNLFRIDVSPELQYPDYYSTTIKQGDVMFVAAVLPPVSAISTINAYNRGSIKYKIEIVSSKYHTGALLVSFTPRAKNVGLSTALQSYNSTLDIGCVQSYEFIVPYINERPYNPRFNRENSTVIMPQLAAIGELNIFVLNKLKSTKDTSESVYINIYMSAGDDFEVAVPAPPMYTVNYDYITPKVTPVCYFKNSCNSLGLDTWRYFYKNDYLVILKYSANADDIMELNEAKPFVVYECTAVGNNKLYTEPFTVSVYARDDKNVVVRSKDMQFKPEYFAVVIVNDDKGKYRYITPFFDLSTATSYINAHKSLATPTNPYPNSPSLDAWAKHSPKNHYFYMAISNTNSGSYRYATSGDVKLFPFTAVNDGVIEAQMDNVIVNPTNKLLSSGQNGLKFFGEQFADLKDYGRRYQEYGTALVKTDAKCIGFRVRVPVTPIGLELNSTTNGLLHTITREGLIGYIASAYRFYRGSLRFKLVVTTHYQPNASSANQYNTWYIQHKPDVMLNTRSISTLLYNNDDVSISDVLQSGYAYTAFSPHINNGISFEIPCYIPTNLLMLQKPDFTRLAETLHYTLGCFDIYGFTNKDTSSFQFTLHYSLADDMDFSCYIGFPPVTAMYKLPNFSQRADAGFEIVNYSKGKKYEKRVIGPIQPEMADESEGDTEEEKSNDSECEDTSMLAIDSTTQTEPEGKLDFVVRPIKNYMFRTTCADIRRKFDMDPVEEDSVYNLILDLAKKIGMEYKDLIVSMVSQILHCMVNPSLSTFVIALITLLSHLGLNAHSQIKNFMSWFGSFFKSSQPEMDSIKTETESEDCIKQSFTMAIVSMGVSMYDKTIGWLKDLKMPNFSKGLFNEMRSGALTITACIVMFKNLFEVVPKIIGWIAKNANPMAWYRWLFSDKKSFINNWVSDVEWFTDPNNLETVKSNMKYAYHGELLVIIGRDICLKMNQIDKVQYDGKYISNLFVKLTQLHQILVSNFKSISGIGIEPYAFRIVGDSQCGKSYVTKELALRALANVGYKSHGNIIYERPKATKHFDGLTGVEAAIYYDDFLHIKEASYAAESISELLTLKSKCLFVPPRADIIDKGKPFNPLILCCTMNGVYPDFQDICQDQYAWMNRFDDTIHMTFIAPPGKSTAINCNNLDPDDMIGYHHCQFSIYAHRNNGPHHPNAEKDFKTVLVPDVENGADAATVAAAPKRNLIKLNFTQLQYYINAQFAKRLDHITQECIKDLKMMNSFRPDVDQDFNINIDKYLNYVKSRNKYLNAQETKTIGLINKLKTEKTCDSCNNSLLICPCNIIGPEAVGRIHLTKEKEKATLDNFIVNEPSTSKSVVNNQKKVEAQMADDATIADMDKNKMSVLVLETIYEEMPADVKIACPFAPLRDILLVAKVPSTLYNDIKTFVKHPCIHTYINVVKSNVVYDVLASSKNVVICTLNYECYSLDDSKCCKLLSTHVPYKKYMYGLYVANNTEPVPEWLKIENRYIDYRAKNMYKQQLILKKQFTTFMDKNVDMESWLTKNGGLLWLICKRMAVILTGAATVYGLINYKSVLKSVKRLNPYYSIEQNNKQYAKILEEHIVTEQCKQGDCIICVNPQMAYDEKKVLRRPRKLVVAKHVDSKKTEAEMAPELLTSLSTQLKRNYFYIVAEKGIERVTARCLGVRGRYFIAIDHYFDKFIHFGIEANYYFCDQQQSRKINFKDIIITKIQNSALLMCQLPRDFPAFKNIVKRFISQDQVESISPMCILYEPQVPQDEQLIGSYDVNYHRNRVILHDDSLSIPDINGKDRYTTVDWYWEYETSGKGLCGSVLFTDMNTSGCIIGLHIAGRPGGGCGYSELVCKETLTNVLDKLEPDPIVLDVEIEGQMFNSNYIKLNVEPKFVKSALDGDFIFSGVVPSRYAYRPPTKSKLMHSICYNRITQSTYDFPHLSHKDPRFKGSPMVGGCLHHTDPPLTFDHDILDIVHDDIKQLILAKVHPIRSKVGVLSIIDSVCGLPHIPQYGAMEMDTSEGFPFSTIRPKHASDKRWLFDLEETADGYILNSISSILLDVMANKQEQRENGIVPMTIFIDCLKDQKLPREKCNKTRIFSVSPVDFTIQFRQYFYDFTIAFQEARFNIESAVGINVDSYEWHQMVSRLLQNSTKFVCGDYSKFGPRLMSNAVIRFFEIICDWYYYHGDRSVINRRIRMIMAHEIAFAQHLMLNMVYQVLCGAPSGCPITTILNNGVNMFYMRSAFISIARENNILMYISDFTDNISIIFYGDDLIMTVKDSVIEWYNATTLSQFFASYDIKFTDALKTGSMSLYTSVFAPETSFLKRNIKRHPYRPIFVGCMDIRAIEETCNWTFQSNDIVSSSIISCESMLLNAHGHGDTYYNTLRESVLQFWRQFGERPNIPTWKEVDWRIYEGLKPFKVIDEL